MLDVPPIVLCPKFLIMPAWRVPAIRAVSLAGSWSSNNTTSGWWVSSTQSFPFKRGTGGVSQAEQYCCSCFAVVLSNSSPKPLCKMSEVPDDYLQNLFAVIFVPFAVFIVFYLIFFARHSKKPLKRWKRWRPTRAMMTSLRCTLCSSKLPWAIAIQVSLAKSVWIVVGLSFVDTLLFTG